MRIVYARCCGLDVHKKSISACLLIPDEERRNTTGGTPFRSDDTGLLLLSDWLAANQVTHVAMESTGVYWKPVWNILQEPTRFFSSTLSMSKPFPDGKQTPRIANGSPTCCSTGLLHGSFIPPSPIRELRDLTRMRASLRQDHTSVANRMQKVSRMPISRSPP